MPFHQRSRKKMIIHKNVMDTDLAKYLFEQHTIHGHILETGKTKQASKNDYHMWCVDKHGNIKDVYAIHHPDIKLTYKEWKTTPSYYKDMIERKLKAFNTWTKEDKIKYFKDTSSVDFNCSTNSCFQKVLFGWDIKVGSVGIEMDDGSILWEFGNGKDYSDFE